jgi:hypothetical protein
VSLGSGCGGGASLANNSFRHIVFTFNAWWVLLTMAIAGGVRLARAQNGERRKTE